MPAMPSGFRTCACHSFYVTYRYVEWPAAPPALAKASRSGRAASGDSVDLGAGCLDDRAPEFVILADQRTERFRIRILRGKAEVLVLLGKLGGLERLLQRTTHLVDDRLRQTGRRDHGKPAQY